MSQQDPLIRLTQEGIKQREVLKTFAKNIIDKQTEEINTFKLLLKNY